MARNRWMRLLVASALALGTVACGDDDVIPFDAGSSDAGPNPDVPSLGDVGPGPDAGPLPDGGPDLDAGGPDGGPDLDAGPGDAGPGDAGGPDAGPMFNPAASAQIVLVRASEGVQDPALAVEGAFVTYVKPAIGSDPAAFFVQGEPEGPALYVAIDPDTLDPVPAVGDTVTFNVTETEIAGSGGQHRVLAITDFARDAEGFDTDTLVQDLSDVGDVITALDDYESELVIVTGTLTDSFGFAGTDHEGADFMTMMIDDEDLIVRIPTDVIASSGVFEGCTFTAGPAPMWRFNDTAQVSAFSDAEITAVTCPAPTVVSAGAIDNATARVTFSSALDMATVMTSDFSVSNGVETLVPSAVVLDGNVATLTLGATTGGTMYTVTVTGVTDIFGADIDPAANTAMFTAVVDADAPGAGDLVITEFLYDPNNADEWIEIHNPSATITYELIGCHIDDIPDTDPDTSGTGADLVAITTSVQIAPGGYLVFGGVGTGGILSVPGLNNSGDPIELRCGGVAGAVGSVLIDTLTYDDGPNFPDASGGSAQLAPGNDATTNDEGSNWCLATTPYGTAVPPLLGTPGLPNLPCP